MKFFKFSITIQTDYSVTVDICKQKLITSTNSFICSNIKFVQTSQYFFQFSLNVRQKSDKDNIVSNALSKLSSTNVSQSEKNYFELNTL